MPVSSSGAGREPKEFVSKLEGLKPAKELDFGPTPGFGKYKKWFPKESVAHPAKMNTHLLEYLVTHYTEPGQVIADPFAGTGSTGVMAALHGRDAVVVELEEKFVAWAEKAKALVDGTPTVNPTGQIRIVKGDARRLGSLLAFSSMTWEQLLIAVSIGDGSLFVHPNGVTPYFSVEHAKKQQPYFDWKVEQLRSKGIEGEVTERTRERKGTTLQSCVFKTRVDERFGEAYRLLYRDGEKRITEELLSRVTPPMLAIWFMDNGSIDARYNAAITLSTDSFPRSDVELLSSWLKKNHDIVSGVHNHGNGWVLTMGREASYYLAELVRPFFHESMVYKINVSTPIKYEWQLKNQSKNARNLSELLGQVDEIVSSPPYANSANGHDRGKVYDQMATDPTSGRFGRKSHPYTTEAYSDDPKNIGNLLPGQVDEVITSPPYADSVGQSGGDPSAAPLIVSDTFQLGMTSKTARKHSEDSDNIGNLEYGKVHVIISSPPYEQSEAFNDTDFMVKIADEQDEKVRAGVNKGHPRGTFRTLKYKSGGHASKGHAASEDAEAEYMARTEAGRITHPDSIGKLKSTPGEIDAVIASPPFERTVSRTLVAHDKHPERRRNQHPNAWLPDAKYSDDRDNIGNAQKETYLQAMMRCYSEMWKVLRPGGRMVIPVKPFQRDHKVVDLPFQTWLLLQKAGFELEEVLKLRLRNLSFWRIIQYRRCPDQEQIRHEYVLVCHKSDHTIQEGIVVHP
ncbi:MAG: hypothetical protein JRN45_00745 [Nitrososphaerota archaeon]|nr:hypothetical protein [Nitrososphaerota archaeon]